MPHSDILGSKPVCGSPKLFAAYHVLHRLLAPRHSPYALSSLTINSELEADTRSSRLQAFGFQRENRVALGWKLAAGNWKLHATAPCALLVRLRPPSRLTALRRDFGEQCFCGRKNYRLQDIQLSKIDPGEQSLGVRASSGLLPRTPSAHSLAGPYAPLRSLAGTSHSTIHARCDASATTRTRTFAGRLRPTSRLRRFVEPGCVTTSACLAEVRFAWPRFRPAFAIAACLAEASRPR